ncbi:MAG: polyhydroxyalkanoate synthesis repressor PhaR [Pseudomonadota bacterium]
MAQAQKTARRKTAAGAAGSDRVVIKKYANRRLYNTARSSYVTLEDLSKMVRDGEDFAVFDAKTGDDITHSVLTQIIFEEEAKGQNMLPTNFLRQLIRLYGDTLQAVVPSYLDASMEAFARNQERMRSAFGSNPALQNLEAMTRSNMELFEQAMRLFTPFGGAAGAPGAAGTSEGASPSEDVAPASTGAAEEGGQNLDELQRQISEMQSRIEALSRERS